MAEWIDQVADFQVATKHFAAVAADLAVAPDAGVVGNNGVSSANPETLVIRASWMHSDIGDGDLQIP